MNYRHAFHAGNFADVVKHLILEVPFVDCPRLFQEPVRQRALTMIDMGYDAEVPNVIHLYYINL